MRKLIILILLIAGYLALGQQNLQSSSGPESAPAGKSAGKTSPIPFLSDLSATRSSALFTTYAAPLSRSSYKLDQGYQFLFNDPESGVEVISSDGPNFGLAFGMGKEFRFMLKELFKEPVITASYSDILKYYYYPFENIRVEVCFNVYSSSHSYLEVGVKNMGSSEEEILISPYHFYPSAD